MAVGKKISDNAQFPYVSVFLEERAKGPRFGVQFWNWEEGSLLSRFFRNLVFAPVLLLCAFAWLLALIADKTGWVTVPEGTGIWAYLAVCAVSVAGGMAAGRMMTPPFKALYQIVIDPIDDQFAIYRGKGRRTAQRPFLLRKLSACYGFSLGPHPDLPLEYEKNKTGKAGPKQKQHCLFGHFGPGGAERVMLVARWEWPPENSLYEVQQALEWTKQIVLRMYETAAAPAGAITGPPGFGGRILPPDDDGGRPPLD
jgi:hypothetical protein